MGNYFKSCVNLIVYGEVFQILVLTLSFMGNYFKSCVNLIVYGRLFQILVSLSMLKKFLRQPDFLWKVISYSWDVLTQSFICMFISPRVTWC